MTDTEVLFREDYHGYVLVARWRPVGGYWEGQAGVLNAIIPLPERQDEDMWSWDDIITPECKTEIGIPIETVMRGPNIPEEVVHVINGQDGRGNGAKGIWPDWSVNDVFAQLKRWVDRV